MPLNYQKIGDTISSLRKIKNMTQSDLGERLHISFQAISKWERGEALPDTATLVDLAQVLETTVDHILNGGERTVVYKGKKTAADMREGLKCFARFGDKVGKENSIYRYAVEGLSEKMHTEIAPMLEDGFLFECLLAETVIQNIIAGYYFDMHEVRLAFSHEKWYAVVQEYAEKYGLK
ncbi:MAG: helix-turn-helix domain-containing protein [Oscillospiraceae bacterium]|jgi:transcriptional regulator with XRE-family HTH domain|nr:helix-turn-helix domain-containing protein [Oscillospiraceae bacterium]